MQGVTPLGLCDAKLVLFPAELVAAIEDTVRPWGEDCAAIRGADLVSLERHDQVPAVMRVAPQRCADAGNVDDIAGCLERVLSARTTMFCSSSTAFLTTA